MLPDPYYYAVKSLFSTNLRFGNYVISGSCKTNCVNVAIAIMFGNYVISGSCKTNFCPLIGTNSFGNYVISGSCKTDL